MNAIAIVLHVLAATIWVGGMFFAYVVLRPSTDALAPPQKLALWAGVFKRFFPWVWMAIIILIATGYWLIFNWFNGLSNTPAYVHLMHIIGWIMAILFMFLYYKTYPAFKQAIENENWPEAGAVMARIRQIILVNLLLGLLLLTSVSALQRLG